MKNEAIMWAKSVKNIINPTDENWGDSFEFTFGDYEITIEEIVGSSIYFDLFKSGEFVGFYYAEVSDAGKITKLADWQSDGTIKNEVIL